MLNKIYVDVDGTLLSNVHDEKFVNKIKSIGFKDAVEWYDNTIVDDLSINLPLLVHLQNLKENNELIIWTNRGVNQIEMTINNLYPFINMFDDMIFNEGKKKREQVVGIVYDNDQKYCSEEQDVLVTFQE